MAKTYMEWWEEYRPLAEYPKDAAWWAWQQQEENFNEKIIADHAHSAKFVDEWIASQGKTAELQHVRGELVACSNAAIRAVMDEIHIHLRRAGISTFWYDSVTNLLDNALAHSTAARAEEGMVLSGHVD